MSIDSKKRPSLIVADTCNYKSLVGLRDKTCKEIRIPFWDTNVKAALILKYFENINCLLKKERELRYR